MRLPEPETTGPRRQRGPTVRSLLPAALAGGSEAELLDLAQLKTARPSSRSGPALPTRLSWLYLPVQGACPLSCLQSPSQPMRQ